MYQLAFFAVRYCSELQPPLHATLNCTKQDFSYQTSCKIACNAGFALNGSAIRNCQANMQWNGRKTSCEGIQLQLVILYKMILANERFLANTLKLKAWLHNIETILTLLIHCTRFTHYRMQ